MKANGEHKDNVAVIQKIMRSMTSKFDYAICSIEVSKDLGSMTTDELQNSLLVHEQRMNSHVEEEQALKVTYGDQFGGRSQTRGGFRGRGRGRGRGRFGKSTMQCFNCHKLGHLQYECPNLEKEANFAEAEEEMLLMAYVNFSDACRKEIWFLDSGCSNHMSGNTELFSDLDEDFREYVKLGNNSSMDVMGKRNVRLRISGIMQVITRVFYVPELKRISKHWELQDKGLAFLIQHGKCKIYHPEKGLIIDVEMSSNRMFKLYAKSQPKESCFSTITEDSTQLWHCRYGHLSFKCLMNLQQKGMVKGLPQLKAPLKLCKDFLVGKKHRNPSP